MNSIGLKQTQLLSFLNSTTDNQKAPPVWLWGPPGTGKSRLIWSYAKENDLDVVDLRACLLESVDVRGLPRFSGDTVQWVPPGFMPREGRGVLFLDELAQAPIPVQNALLQLALDRKIGEYTLPEGWRVVAASNRLEDRAGANRTTSALNSRFCHVDLLVSSDDWLTWAATTGLNSEVRSFIMFKPTILHSFDAGKGERAFPSPRSWEFVSNLISSIPSDDMALAILGGVVGQGAAGEFLGYRRVYASLPNIEQVLFEKCDVPKKPDIVYALLGAATEYLRTHEEKRVDKAVCQLFNRLNPEYAVAGYKQAVAIRPELVHPTKGPTEAREFFTKNRHMLQG